MGLSGREVSLSLEVLASGVCVTAGCVTGAVVVSGFLVLATLASEVNVVFSDS